MAELPAPLRRCLDVLRKLPGVGPKSAQRILFHLLEKGPEAPRELSDALQRVAEDVVRCSQCRTYQAAGEPCPLCSDAKRDPGVLCIVETPSDVYLVEETGEFRGRYHVLHGLLSPLRGVRPEDLGLEVLEKRLGGGEVREVILATPPTSEGEATASFLAAHLEGRVSRISRIAYGLPVGAEFQYVDAQTLSRALSGRKNLTS
ncbi:MAG: recombination mediator RecR [Acidobacteriota bacterium]